MTDESIEIFRWVFKEFASLMGGRAPGTVLTGDQVVDMHAFLLNPYEVSIHDTFFLFGLLTTLQTSACNGSGNWFGMGRHKAQVV
jgi:hypothetical protein